MNREKQNARYKKWWNNITKEEEKLRFSMINYEDRYFKDMTLAKFEKKLTGVIEEKSKKRMYSDLSMAFESLVPMSYWILRVNNRLEKKYDGKCIPKTKTIIVRKSISQNDKKITLLHEMIHAYESMLPIIYREYLLIYFYKLLNKKIKNIDDIISLECHIDLHVHSLLFCFKSIDLDLRLKQKFGTIYSYGREETFDFLKRI